MKKFFACWLTVSLVCCLLFGTTMFVSASDDEQQQTYTTSDGITYSLSDFDIYIEDFAEVEFETSQEVIDYVYTTGVRRNIRRDTVHSIFGKQLTEDEIDLIILHPAYGIIAYNCSENAKSTAQTLYPDNHSDGDLGNAFQHGYWVSLMYFRTSPTFAIDFAVAHENYEGNPELHKTMDLFNNNAAYNYCSWSDFETTPTDEELKDFVLELMEYGYFEYIIFDYEYVARSVYYMATGQTRLYYGHLDLYAYTDSTIPYNIPDTVYEVVPLNPNGPILRP